MLSALLVRSVVPKTRTQCFAAQRACVQTRGYKASRMMRSEDEGEGEDGGDDTDSGLDIDMREPGEKRKTRKATKAYIQKREKKRAALLMKKAGLPIDLPPHASAKDLARLLGVKTVELIKILIGLGIAPRSSEELLLPEVVDLLCSEFHRVPNRGIVDMDLYPRPPPGDNDVFPPRPPVVTILGHVNHGKTTLLDALRAGNKSIADTESGGITQHMGAFSVLTKSGEKLTVLDTPGHAAFEAMRERGAKLADIAILVVDGTRGVQPQTITSYRYLRSAGIPIVVAVTKADRKGFKFKQTKTELTQLGLNLEEGNTPAIAISAVSKEGIPELIDAILLEAGLMDIKADKEGRAEVVVLETRIDKARGLVSSGVVKCGTFKKNSLFVVAKAIGKVRRIFNPEGKLVDCAYPGDPIEFTGYDSKDKLPNPGDVLIVVETERIAKDTAAFRERKEQELERGRTQIEDQEAKLEEKEKENLDKLFALENGLDADQYVKLKREEREALKPREVPIILKADVSGSIEAIGQQIKLLPRDQLNVKIVQKGIGPISDADVRIAMATENKCMILGFHVPVSESAKGLANQHDITIETFDIIYGLLDYITGFCASLLPPDLKYIDVASAEIKQVFEIKKGGSKTIIAGCLVKKGSLKRGADVQVRRGEDGEVVWTGKIRQLRFQKEVVKVMESGRECGVLFTNDFSGFEEGDLIVAVETQYVRQKFLTNEYERPKIHEWE
eukprot:TRINITY_DN6570_c0_g1_i1.p1 TRINITY_DN6570_c0_g1~~TRINITY_DN6570_c0_g1_i1.p1  ORF type:complete len:730 (+),score=194.63 TRINITY_DN6570_c0_g1_i1:18-2207(+)